jgi:hypothetical protein
MNFVCASIVPNPDLFGRNRMPIHRVIRLIVWAKYLRIKISSMVLCVYSFSCEVGYSELIDSLQRNEFETGYYTLNGCIAQPNYYYRTTCISAIFFTFVKRNCL